MIGRYATAVLLTLGAAGFCSAVTPPPLLNYQGVLRDAEGVPRTGTYAMEFRFFDSAAGGQPILVDQHAAVQVEGGLFSVRIGGGLVLDGDGPGNYTYLPRVFADYQNLHLEIEIDGEVLEPRTPLASAGHAFNARYVNGMRVAIDTPRDYWVDASAGSDDSSGLSPLAPLATIQEAVDRIPTILGADVTVHVAPGTYAEQVRLYDRAFRGVASITILGDGPGARITGEFSRSTAFEVRSVKSFVLENLEFVDTTGYNLRILDSTGTVRGCTLTTSTGQPASGYGVLITRSFVTIENSTLSDHAVSGLVCTSASRCFLNNVSLTGNYRGMEVLKAAQVRFTGPATVTDNSIGGLAFGHGQIDFLHRSDVQVTGNSSQDLNAHLLSAIFAYSNASVGDCVADDNSVCSSGRGPEHALD